MNCRACGYDEERQVEMNNRNMNPTSSFMSGIIVEPDFIQREAKKFKELYFSSGPLGFLGYACPYCGTVKVEI